MLFLTRHVRVLICSASDTDYGLVLEFDNLVPESVWHDERKPKRAKCALYALHT